MTGCKKYSPFVISLERIKSREEEFPFLGICSNTMLLHIL
jgi:hypothetical protein